MKNEKWRIDPQRVDRANDVQDVRSGIATYLPTCLRRSSRCLLMLPLIHIFSEAVYAQNFQNGDFEGSSSCSATNCAHTDISCIDDWWNWTHTISTDESDVWYRYDCQESDPVASPSEIYVYPNPFDGEQLFVYVPDLTEEQEGIIEVFDATGKRLLIRLLNSQHNQIAFDKALIEGFVFYRVTGDGITSSGTLTIIK